MFIHFSIILIIYKKKKVKFDQKSYDLLFQNIENNLRELGIGDVSVNKKMKDFNKILYDILLKIKVEHKDKFIINKKLILKYFEVLNEEKSTKYDEFEQYFLNFYNFCFELSLENMIRDAGNYTYGSS
jgi:cytochrome b pre-mRNA-processing protein 3